ncbi:MAG: multiple sugar transport system substrate-binding protein, partial [Micromonosporaceae bacterium]|nr:multiple sugar transport system substrate-binding protein [Micromonosporaceae bacterium]
DSYSNAFAAALQNKTPLSGALTQMQQATVNDMKQRGFNTTG